MAEIPYKTFDPSDLVIDFEHKCVSYDGKSDYFTTIEMKMLASISNGAPHPVHRDLISESIWGDKADSMDSSGFDNLYRRKNFQNKLEGLGLAIRNEEGFGYLFKCIASGSALEPDKSLAEDSHSIILLASVRDALGPASVLDVRRFFRGFEATWELIRDEIPAERGFYPPRKKQLLEEALRLAQKGGLNLHVIVGSKGSGKTTLAKRLAFDLATAGHNTLWVQRYPRRLSKNLVPEYRHLIKKGQRTHLFAEIQLGRWSHDPLSQSDSVLKEALDFVRSIGVSAGVSLYLEIDTNHFEEIRDDLEILGVPPPLINLIKVPFNLDDDEIEVLVSKLIAFDCAGRLQGRPESEIRKVFRRKANKVLLATLIEATSGVSDDDNLDLILRREYQALPASFRTIYPLVALADSFGIHIPLTLALATMLKAPGSVPPSLEQLRTSLREVIEVKGLALSTRHPLIAKVLCRSLDASQNSESTFWLPLIEAIVTSVNENEPEHVAYLEAFSGAKVVSILKDELQSLATHLAERRFSKLSDRSTALLLNAAARSFQGRHDFSSAIEWASVSRGTWQTQSNPADVTLAYCYLSTRNQPEAVRLAEGFLADSSRPWRTLHAIRILCKAGKAREAEKVMTTHKNDLSTLPGFGSLRGDVLRSNVGCEDLSRDENPWVRGKWVRMRLEGGLIEAGVAIEILIGVLEQEPNVHTAFTDCVHLMLMEARYQEIIDLSKRIERGAEKTEIIPGAPQLIDARTTRSMSLATQGWALVQRDGRTAATRSEELFQQSLTIRSDNAWAHNWRGLVLHATEQQSRIAEEELRKAIECRRNTPPFYRNLARVIIETNVKPFLISRNEEAIRLCERGLVLSPPESYWNWGGLRAELQALLNYAESLRGRKLLDGISLADVEQILDADESFG
ncbi:MAG: hypothetical protein M3O31_15485 [Acidobacteriota bacterium]|nr:hypothetical protein [Acidobacteriota bacterium]